MKRIIQLLCVAAVLAACNNQGTPAVDTAKAQQAVLDADKGFSAMAVQEGLGKAMEKYYDDSVVAIISNAPVGIGKAAILKNMAELKMDSLKTLTWIAEKAAVSASGDLGYTWGHFQLKFKTKDGNDTISYGAYCTVYKKEADGSWKAVVDQSNDTPKP